MFLRFSCVALVLVGLSTLPGVSVADGGLKTAGSVLSVGLPVVAAGISVAQDDASGFFQLMKSEAATILASQALKHTVHETRPNGSDNKSFPSEHAAVAFSAAQFMQMKGGWEFGVPAYIAATAVGYSRVHSNEHRWKDVVAGAALGIGTSYYFTDTNEKTKFSVLFGQKSAYAQVSSTW